MSMREWKKLKNCGIDRLNKSDKKEFSNPEN